MNDLLIRLTEPFEPKHITLTKGYIALVDEIDFVWLSQWKWCFDGGGYAIRGTRVGGKFQSFRMHREILIHAGIEIPQGYYVDHANGNRGDNRRQNLRVASPSQSGCNSTRDNQSGYRGVYFRVTATNHPWEARIVIDGKVTSLGHFPSAFQAEIEFDRAAIEHYGEFAKLNFQEVGETHG